jgi:hypothetical protein
MKLDKVKTSHGLVPAIDFQCRPFWIMFAVSRRFSLNMSRRIRACVLKVQPAWYPRFETGAVTLLSFQTFRSYFFFVILLLNL